MYKSFPLLPHEPSNSQISIEKPVRVTAETLLKTRWRHLWHWPNSVTVLKPCLAKLHWAILSLLTVVVHKVIGTLKFIDDDDDDCDYDYDDADEGDSVRLHLTTTFGVST